MKTYQQFIAEQAELLGERAKMSIHVKHGAFHAWLGKSEDEPITNADIQRGLRAGGHAAKMANFAKNARKWHHEEAIVEKKAHSFTARHPYVVGTAAGATIGGALGAGIGKALPPQYRAASMASGALAGAASSGISTLGYKIRKKHPALGGFLSGGVHGAIASKTSSYSEEAPPGAKYERMVHHIKGAHPSKKQKEIAYATAWKRYNQAHGK